MSILEHPIYKAIYDLCRQIETFPASEQQTKTVVMASNLEIPAKQLISERDALQSRCEQLEAKCAEMREALYLQSRGCDCHSLSGRAHSTDCKMTFAVNHALSSDCGKGMISVRELDKIKDGVQTAKDFPNAD